MVTINHGDHDHCGFMKLQIYSGFLWTLWLNTKEWYRVIRNKNSTVIWSFSCFQSSWNTKLQRKHRNIIAHLKSFTPEKKVLRIYLTLKDIQTFFVSQLSFQCLFSTWCHVFNHQGAVFKYLPQVYRIALDSLRHLVVQSVLTLVCISSSQIKDVWVVKPLWLFLLVSLISSVILGGFTSFINTSISSIQVVFVLVLYLSGWMTHRPAAGWIWDIFSITGGTGPNHRLVTLG